ncbi:MAG: LacI family DNA-binding transcriptional regulator [Clostridia bacterium]|nr:LacI family DNA-binding transcriptional regulator [Clostridia bacterium]
MKTETQKDEVLCMAVTIGDVAREANVSISTISRVVNGSKAVSTELRQRVDQAIEKTGYRPNVLARSLITNRTHTIGLAVSDISNSVMAVIAKGISSVCQKNGYTVIMCETSGKSENEIAILDKLGEYHVEGLAFAGVNVGRALADKMLEMSYPVVLVNQKESYGETRIMTISYDNYQASYDTAALLIGAGHRRIAMIGGPENDYSAGIQRLMGYQKALEDAGLEWAESYVQRGDFSFESGFQGMKRIYEESMELPTAVLCGSDLVAIGAMQSAYNLGLSVPEDISIIGFDDSEMGRYTRPTLSTVRIPYFDEGELAANTLLCMIKDPSVKPEFICVRHKVIRRMSITQRK